MEFKHKIAIATCVVLLSGCAQRVADLTLASTKSVELNSNSFTTGKRVIGEDVKPIILFPLGNPSIKEATNRAIEQDKCAVALTDVAVDFEFFSFFLGYLKYSVEGDLVIDRSQSNCQR